jgi:hypothetical protein
MDVGWKVGVCSRHLLKHLVEVDVISQIWRLGTLLFALAFWHACRDVTLK